jgi:hypothetical protein
VIQSPAATPPLEPSTPAPVSTRGPGAPTSPSAALERLLTANRENQTATPLIRTRAPAPPQKSFGETFGAATGVSDPRLQKIQIRNHHAGGKAATVAGYAGPGFHNWPPGHIPQDNGSESASPHPVPYQKDVRRRDRGQRPTATKEPHPSPLFSPLILIIWMRRLRERRAPGRRRERLHWGARRR